MTQGRTHAPRLSAVIDDAVRSPGTPLPPATQAVMGGQLGSELGDVRVHSGAEAEQSAATIGALAFTVGNDIVFGRGAYDPVSPEGRGRLAHELTHVVQQRSTPLSAAPGMDVVDPDPAAELEAQRVGVSFARGSAEILAGAAVPIRSAAAPRTVQRNPADQAASPSQRGGRFREGALDSIGQPPMRHELGHVVPRRASTAARLIQRQSFGDIGFVGPPTPEEFSIEGLRAATRILGAGNFRGSVHHKNAFRGSGTLPQAIRWMLFEFWLARSARETRELANESNSSYRHATMAERLARLVDGRRRADELLSEMGPRPLLGDAGDAARAFKKAYDDAHQRVFDEAVEAGIEAIPLETIFEAPAVELEQQRRAVGDIIAAINHFLATLRVASSTAVRLTPEITAMLHGLGTRFPSLEHLVDATETTVRGPLFRARGVLNGLNTILVLTDERRRTDLMEAKFSVRSTAARSRFILGMIEGGVQFTSIIGGVIARQRGNAKLATRLFGLGTGTMVRTIGWLAALAQTMHGIAVLVDPASTESERLQGVFDVAMGTAGLTGAATILGVDALAALAGPLSVGVAVTAAELAYLRSKIRGMETGMATAGIRQSLGLIEYEADGVANRANRLQRALGYRSASVGPEREEIRAATQHRIDFLSRRLRERLAGAIERVTTRQGSIPILFQPSSWTHLRQPFLALQPQLDAARSPTELLAVAAAYLATARNLFRHIERTITRTLIEVDRAREGGLLPHPLGGLHDKLTERAAAEQD